MSQLTRVPWEVNGELSVTGWEGSSLTFLLPGLKQSMTGETGLCGLLTPP